MDNQDSGEGDCHDFLRPRPATGKRYRPADWWPDTPVVARQKQPGEAAVRWSLLLRDSLQPKLVTSCLLSLDGKFGTLVGRGGNGLDLVGHNLFQGLTDGLLEAVQGNQSGAAVVDLAGAL